MPWLWHRLTAASPIHPLARELPYAVGAAVKRKNKKPPKKKKKKIPHTKTKNKKQSKTPAPVTERDEGGHGSQS